MIRAGLLMGDVYFAVDESGQILAIAIWSPPGDTLFSRWVLLHPSYAGPYHLVSISEEQRALGVNDLFARLSEEAKDWWKAVVWTFCCFETPHFTNIISSSSARRHHHQHL